MQSSRARRGGAVLCGLALAAGGSIAGASTDSGGELEGMRGTTPMGADIAGWIGGVSDFWVERGNPPLTDFNYAGESYDAVILIALAVEQAKTDGSEHANHIVDVSGPPAPGRAARWLASSASGTDRNALSPPGGRNCPDAATADKQASTGP